MNKYFILSALVGGLLLSLSARAQISVDKMVVDVFKSSPREQNIFVSNVSNDMAYVASDAFEILNPGEENEQRVPVDLKAKNRLIVVPSKLSIDSAEKRNLQFIVNEAGLKKDRIYRVSIVPKVADIQGTQSIGIKILMGYDILVIVRPDQPQFDLKVERGKNEITFKNNGNTNILLNNVKQCTRVDQCTTILTKRLYAGNKLTAQLVEPDKPVIVDMFYGEEAKTQTY